MRWPILILIALVVLLQYPLWLGKGGWLRVWEVDRQLHAQREENLRLEQRNAALAAWPFGPPTTIDETMALRRHFLSAGTTRHGACSVEVRRRTTS